jgi:exopolyphosphatase/guanosine-5'-triphosphate,3'-diphosphate pyrophosphatase
MADQSFQPFGVIDIGSNSVRLVLFDGIRRAPASFFNEKVLCGLGRSMAETGVLDPEGRTMALAALSRFRLICEKMGVGAQRLECFATAAVREASDGQEFIEEANAILGQQVRVLSGEQEARQAASGVLTGIPDLKGWVADLGGGSLELAEVADGEISNPVSFPFGPLRLAGLKRKVIKPMLREAFSGFVSSDGMGTLCLVGGAWRTLAKLHMTRTKYPVKVLHHYALDAKEARDFAHSLNKKSLPSMSEVEGISERRLETIPTAALILRKLIDALEPADIVISAHGVREGIMYDRLDPVERAKDPLIEGARAMASRRALDLEVAVEVVDFAADFFSGNEIFSPRIIETTSRLSNIAWRDHPNYRRGNILHAVLHAPLDGLSHPDRIRIALSLYYRYGGESSDDARKVVKVVGPEDHEKARTFGAFLRFAHVLVGQAPGILPACSLAQDDHTVTLTVSQGMSGLVGEVVLIRLEALGELLEKKTRVEVRDYL